MPAWRVFELTKRGSSSVQEPLWTPSPERVASSQLTHFMRRVSKRRRVTLSDYDALHAFSISERAAFWEAFWRFADIRASNRVSQILGPSDAMPGADWYVGAELNYAENMLFRAEDGPAIIAHAEGQERRVVTWPDLRVQVARTANALRAAGVEKGDRVAGFVANCPEAIIGLLASASIGAIWCSCSPDFGVRGVLDRFGQIEPKVLFAVDGYRYGGKEIDCLDKIAETVAELPTLQQTVIIPYLEQNPKTDKCQFVTIKDFQKDQPDEIDFEQVEFAHPLYILFSSGTTGVPKAIVHSTGGVLLQHAKELRLQSDVGPGDRLYFFTTCGWMMWNWLASGLVAGATLVLYDGSPFHPDGMAQFRIAADEGVTHFGAGAKFYDAIRKGGLRPRDEVDLSSLRTMLSTGSPLVAETFDYLYDAVQPDMHLASISGGTDIVSCFVLGNPNGPVWAGEIQAPGLGMAVEVWDEKGRSVIGQKGELVCTRAFPAMPVAFWNDPDGARYHKAYFDRFPGVWNHGDYAERTVNGGFIIHGRSDAVLNPGGVRIGTAEIYRQVETIDEVVEAVCVGQDWDDDVRVVLFVRLADGSSLTDEVIDKVRVTIRTNCSPRHVPAKVIAVDDIPRTRSGKIAEIAVRDVIHDRPVENTEALANPESLDLYRGLVDLTT
ncbi:MAG: acetoacetate--CoA ligase [Pseudomonadota bacterium]